MAGLQQKLAGLAILAVCLLGVGAGGRYPSPILYARTSSLNPPAQPIVTPIKPVEVTVDASGTEVASTGVSEPQNPSGFVGSYGWLIPGFNCVTCVRELTGRGQSGNAGTWFASHSVPHVGDIMILRPFEQGAGPIGHVMVVEGINGSTVYTAGCNYSRTVFTDNGEYF